MRKDPALLRALLFYPVFLAIGLLNASWTLGGWYRLAFPLSALLLMAYSLDVLRVSTPRQRMLFLGAMLVCAVGENICVHVLGLYRFAGADGAPYPIPPYVVMGHGYTLWAAVVLAERAGERFGAERALRALLLCGAAYTALRALATADWTGALWFALFAIPYALCRRTADKLLLAATYLLATGLELAGVWVRAWEWTTASSPPAGVGGFYAAADWLTLLLLRSFRLVDAPSDELT
jgi:hypothetical protein